MILIAGAIAIVIAAAGWFVWRSQTADNEQSRGSSASVTVTADEVAALVGRWRRTDGGYIIEIRGLDADGYLDVGYYNPRPINVSQARVVRSPRGLHIFVELWDTGYPGATYQLDHDEAKDQLTGVYHQPTAKQSFDVIFVRAQ